MIASLSNSLASTLPHTIGSPPAFEVSIVVVSFNTRNLLRECLQSIMAETASIVAEIMVVDNASTDGSGDMVATEFPHVVLLRSEVNLGFGAANNLAIQQARGRYLVLLNSDAFFAPGALALSIRHMDESPGCALGGCRLVSPDGSAQPSSRSFHSLLTDAFVLTGLAAKFPRSRLFGHFDRTWADENHPAAVDWVPGAFSIIRPDALQKVGLFDPAFFLYYEEVDLCLRMKQAGLHIWYWPDIVVTHIGGQSSLNHTSLEVSSQAAQVILWRMRSTMLYYRKHHGIQVYLARALESTIYRISVLRNRFSGDPRRQERARYSQSLLALVQKAWKDTSGGRVSPPRPW